MKRIQANTRYTELISDHDDLKGVLDQKRNNNKIKVMINSLDSYTLFETLGEGAFGEVRKAQAEDGTEYAIKIFDLGQDATPRK